MIFHKALFGPAAAVTILGIALGILPAAMSDIGSQVEARAEARSGLGDTEDVSIEVPIIAGSDDAGISQSCDYSTSLPEIYFGVCGDGTGIMSGFR